MFFCINVKKAAYRVCTVILVAAIVLLGANCIRLYVSSAGDDAVETAAQTSVNAEVFVPVLMYHSILDNSSRTGDYVVDRKVFEADMEYLIENGYNTVFVSDLIDYVEGNAELPEKPVVVTFDDGYYNVMAYAYPFMKEHGLKGVVNIVGSYTDISTDHDEHNPAYSNLTWNEIAELNDSGVFEIGNHTYDMHSLEGRRGCKRISGESSEEYRSCLFSDIGMLQGLLEDKSGVRPVTFAYPYGFITDESVEIIKEMGFKALLTCYEKPNYISRDDPECLMCINRYNRPSGISTEQYMEKTLKN